MEKKLIKIITDSSCDLPKEIIKKYDITVVPMNISMDNQEFSEGIDLTPEEFYARMIFSSDSEELPKTSQPSPQAFADVFSTFHSHTELLWFDHLIRP